METLVIIAVTVLVTTVIIRHFRLEKPVSHDRHQSSNASPKTARAWSAEKTASGRHRVMATPSEDSVDKGEHRIHGADATDDDASFATFTLSFGASETPSNNQEPGRWVFPGSTVTVAGHVLSGGFFYFGGKLDSQDGFATEAALIDESLEVTHAADTETDESLGYWPKYISLSPRCRGAYLQWLASERNNPDTPIGYVFLYFYGLERRAVVDGVRADAVTDDEFEAIVNEVRRLIGIYGNHSTFGRYAYRLLEWMKLMRPECVQVSDEEIAQWQLRQLFALNAGRQITQGNPIPDSMAFTWLSFTDFTPRTAARRCQSQFQELFKIQYRQRFGDGLTVKPNKTMVNLHYRPASASISVQTLPNSDIPDPTVLTSVSKRLIQLADECTDQLDAFSRYVGREGQNESDIEGLLLLPDELTRHETPSALARFDSWADAIIEQNHGVANVADLWGQIRNEPVDKINKKELEIIRNLMAKIGCGFAPDPRYHDAKPSPQDKIVLHRGGLDPDYAPTDRFRELGVSLRLGAMVAAIDGEIHDNETVVLRRLIDREKDLMPAEKISLHAYLSWRLNTPVNAASLKTQIEKLSGSAKETISRILISVALADGRVDSHEIKQLEKLYTSLGLERALVASDIHGLTTERSPISTSTSSAKAHDKGHAGSGDVTGGFKIDYSVLARHEAETGDAQDILDSIFATDEPEEEEDQTLGGTNVAQESSADELDSAHRKLYEKLIDRQSWSRSEVEALCQDLELMVDGALEAINDWAFNQVNEPVLDDEGDVYVRHDVVTDILGQ